MSVGCVCVHWHVAAGAEALLAAPSNSTPDDAEITARDALIESSDAAAAIVAEVEMEQYSEHRLARLGRYIKSSWHALYGSVIVRYNIQVVLCCFAFMHAIAYLHVALCWALQ